MSVPAAGLSVRARILLGVTAGLLLAVAGIGFHRAVGAHDSDRLRGCGQTAPAPRAPHRCGAPPSSVRTSAATPPSGAKVTRRA
ncbi:hypothetical protein AB0F71_20065 [Kitasatospora sp. NPDC028055]|uniref:hypothetical protein n=1 Tax=Kitasatospora sp. NPDC028055 TaxID=3155653 RepID=UPI003407499B